jgi:putative nucleotidyltransferase with HDIG domain
MKTYKPDDLIAAEGDQLTSTQGSALAQLNKQVRQSYYFRLVGLFLLAAICYSSIGFYLTRQRTLLNFSASNVVMLALPVLLAVGVGRLLIFFDVDPALRWVLFPSALVGMLSAVMIGPQVGFILVLLASVLFGVAMNEPMDFFILALFGGFTAVISLHRIRQRTDVLVAGIRVAVVNVVTVWFLALFDLPPRPHISNLVAAFVMGIVCGSLTLPLIAIFEKMFDIVTDIRLYEITGPQNELIRMMEEKAPGTYQHVLNVTKLAESAAEAIEANFMLVRSGAYFHDIGKMLKPKYFTENQVTLEDKKAHSRLSPYMSTLIIKNHVKEGIELAKKHGLPQKVIDFIPQHHGTSLIKYFYNEALQRYEETESTDVVREEDFRYPGPKPQTIEAAIVMLADSVEAIVTSVFTQSQVNENDLRRVVAQAIADRFSDGQFDECDLTMRDLFLIRESFIKTLKARFHQRIAYQTTQRRDAPREGREAGAAPAQVAAG